MRFSEEWRSFEGENQRERFDPQPVSRSHPQIYSVDKSAPTKGLPAIDDFCHDEMKCFLVARAASSYLF